MRRALLKPSWLAMHVLVAALCLVMLRLGVWQWGRGEVRGSVRNYSYGLEWWAFSALTIVGWVKFCLDETADVDTAAVLADSDDEAAHTGATGAGSRSGRGRPTAGHSAPRHTAPRHTATRDSAPAAPVDYSDDPELAAWNARFAELARRDAESNP